MLPGARAVATALAAAAVPGDAAELSRFFKTGKGEYGAGDKFVGVRVPAIRAIAKQHADLSPADLNDLLDSEFHEHRFAALAILVHQYKKAAPADREWFYDFYLAAMRRGRINNWDLVDSSAEFIVGEYLYDKPRDLLFRLSRSGIVWERRIAVLSTFAFIKHGDASTTLELAASLLDDRHDLIHKAVGWMLREVGKRVDRDLLVAFLRQHAARMPRVMLSYATEHLSPAERVYFRSR
ncbi:MAG: DNA alkylation repair protein [Actinobacteria bacterium]|nr:DNA alkylation repair protein [Actinomycetota bacterium]